MACVGGNGFFLTGLSYTQPIGSKIGLTLSASYGSQSLIEDEYNWNPIYYEYNTSNYYRDFTPILLDVSYRVFKEHSFNIFIGSGFDLSGWHDNISKFGCSYGIKSFVLSLEAFSYRYNPDFVYTPLVFGVKWFFK